MEMSPARSQDAWGTLGERSAQETGAVSVPRALAPLVEAARPRQIPDRPPAPFPVAVPGRLVSDHRSMDTQPIINLFNQLLTVGAAVAAVICAFFIMLAGYQYMTAGGSSRSDRASRTHRTPGGGPARDPG